MIKIKIIPNLRLITHSTDLVPFLKLQADCYEMNDGFSSYSVIIKLQISPVFGE